MRARVVLEDGFHLEGEAFAGEGEVCAEIVCHTDQTGYQEVLTDPANYGRAVVFTIPIVGNYGVNPDDSESERITPQAVLVREYTDRPSNYRATQSLGDWLGAASVLGVHRIDTRALVLHLREHGPKKAVITTKGGDVEELARRAAAAPSRTENELLAAIGPEEPYTYCDGGNRRVAVLDLGVRRSFLAQLAEVGCRVTVLPARASADEILAHGPDVVVVAGGPEEPLAWRSVRRTVEALLGRLPVFGIGLGHLLVGQACGLDVFPLTTGHRGGGHPVRELETGEVLMTSQNHGYALAVPEGAGELTAQGPSGPAPLRVTHRSLFDGTVEGLAVPAWQVYTVQFQPEASRGPGLATYVPRLFERIGDDA